MCDIIFPLLHGLQLHTRGKEFMYDFLKFMYGTVFPGMKVKQREHNWSFLKMNLWTTLMKRYCRELSIDMVIHGDTS